MKLVGVLVLMLRMAFFEGARIEIMPMFYGVDWAFIVEVKTTDA